MPASFPPPSPRGAPPANKPVPRSCRSGCREMVHRWLSRPRCSRWRLRGLPTCAGRCCPWFEALCSRLGPTEGTSRRDQERRRSAFFERQGPHVDSTHVVFVGTSKNRYLQIIPSGFPAESLRTSAAKKACSLARIPDLDTAPIASLREGTHMEIFLILPLIALGGVFAMAEIALVSVRKPRLQQWAATREHERPGGTRSCEQTGNIPRDRSDGHDARRHLCRSVW